MITIEDVRAARPLVHCITNYVTVGDCANALLASGASPIMADDADEAAEIAAICAAVCINIGTLNDRTIPSMRIAGLRARELGHPVVLDPVGAGASKLRTQTAEMLAREVRPSIIRGNASEIRALDHAGTGSRGVDADDQDALVGSSIETFTRIAADIARSTGAVVGVSGATDIITDGSRVCLVHNGHELMSRITGSGCMLSCITAAFAASGSDMFEACAGAFVFMGSCGEIARERMTGADGTAAFRGYLIDAMSTTSSESIAARARYEVRSI